MSNSAHRTRSDTAGLPWLALIWLGACLLLGGASNAGVLANAVLQAGAVAIIVGAIWRRRGGMWPAERFPGLILAFVLGGGLLSLLPLPPSLWSAIPGRAEIVQGYSLLGLELPWLAISLTDERTVRSLLALLVPLASYLTVRGLPATQGNRLVWLLGGFAVVSVMLGTAQYLGGTDSPLRLYQNTNRTVAVGFFANANHFATLLLVTIAFIFAANFKLPQRRKSTLSKLPVDGVTPYAIAGLTLVGLVLAGSGAGLLLAAPALAIGWLIRRSRTAGSGRSAAKAVGAMALLGLIAAVALMASGQVADKLGTSATSRSTVSSGTLAAAADHFPTGSGLGSFAQVYLAKSGGQGTTREWMNHAHNDVAEVLLELGLVGGLAMVLALLWLARSTIRLWRNPGLGETGDLGRGAALACWLMLAHSVVDYPLRTAAMAALLGVAVALITNAFAPPKPTEYDPG